MELWLALLLILLGVIGGFVGGFFMARRYMMNYFKENPPIDERMISAMMAQMGQKPSAKKVKQIMQSMKMK
ncbi:YneF family protein [Aerococcaceae bacterium NML191292]|nr:YneF family protein [Aerococcaceae bacterium NML210727]MCW6654131.1 YneF family protein [Aerococcaceae bacterium NML201296]MCW6659829.1 YneF family protein [Aerococcaceae bacterium NML191292]MCW6661830.1 YneF family protein [Aerococcaceae bacterium NML201209]MCW6663637.1 YneF family protein [Aerococcaceae bacterium NML190073]MCW6665045.1 YneF family protein [Aerococcaceae bacterium NML191219]MCW6666405.1 YneF family protein [Aerococcaceae bacterium NML190938]MCW6675373.1 YneF family prote